MKPSPLTPTQRAERLDAALSDIATAVERLASGQDWQAWLDLTARLGRHHRYSARNTMWLWQQALTRDENLSVVGGYRWWQSIGRQVRRGERAYRVLAPVTRRPDDDDRGDDTPGTRAAGRMVVGWRIESVFDLSQTDGDPLPEHPGMVMPTGDGPQGGWDALAGLLAAGGWTVERQAIPSQTQGYTEWASRRVVVRPDLGPAAAFYVLAHEAAHVHLHEHSDLARPLKEVEADSVAYLIADALGLDTATATFPYVTGWSGGDPAAVLAVAGRATDAAAAILDALSTIPGPAPLTPAPAEPIPVAA